MNRRIPLVILTTLVLGLAGFGLSQLNEAQKLKQSLAALDQERAALQKRLWDLQKRNNELQNRSRSAQQQQTAALETNDGPGGPGGPGGAPGARGPRWDGRGEFGRFNAMLANPEVQKLMSIQQKAGLDGHYSSLFKALQLSPADLDKFKNLLVEKQASVMDVLAAARAQGLDPRDNRDQMKQLVKDAQDEVDNNIKTTLGDAAYAQYQNFEATAPQRNTVTQLEQRLSYSSSPLSDSQSLQLVQILADTSPAKNPAGGASIRALSGAFGGPGMGGSPITDAAIAQAQSVLSTQQLSALQSLQQEQQANAQLMQQMRNRTPSTATASATPSPVPPGG